MLRLAEQIIAYLHLLNVQSYKNGGRFTHSFLALKASANSLTLLNEARSRGMASTRALC